MRKSAIDFLTIFGNFVYLSPGEKEIQTNGQQMVTNLQKQ